MNRLRAVGRMMRGLLHIGAGFWLVFVRFPRLQTTHREAAVQAWAQRMLAVWRQCPRQYKLSIQEISKVLAA